MKIVFSLDGKEIEPDLLPHMRLNTALRRELGHKMVKGECFQGSCGQCLITIDGLPTLACLVPVFMVRGREIKTIEAFYGDPDYKRIIDGFSIEGYSPCSHCIGGRIQVTNFLGRLEPVPSEQQILHHMSYAHCSCSSYESMVRGVQRALITLHQTRR